MSTHMSKRLQIDYMNVTDVHFGEKTSLEGSVLTLNKEELLAVAASNLFGSLDIKLACPGESCRILSIHDVMQPRCKVDHLEESYPSIWASCLWLVKGVQLRSKELSFQISIMPNVILNTIWIWEARQPSTATSLGIFISA